MKQIKQISLEDESPPTLQCFPKTYYHSKIKEFIKIKIKNCSSEEISNNCNLLISHIIVKKLVHISRLWVYIGRHCNYNKF